MAKLLVIVGITGTQGSSVYNTFKHEPGWRIRGLTRDPTKLSCKALIEAGVEVVKADLDDEASLEPAFEGANVIYAVTDFFQHLFSDPSIFAQAEREGKKPTVIAMERETVHGKNIVHAAAKQLSTLDRLIFSTLSDARKWSNGEIMNCYHHNSTATAVQYLKDEFPALAARTSYLQLGMYMTNWQHLKPIFFQKQRDGSMLMRYHIYLNSHPQPFVSAPEDTGAFARTLILSQPPNTTMVGYREMMTMESYAALWGHVNNIKTTYRPYTISEAIEAGLPEWLVEELWTGGEYYSKYGCTGGDPEAKTPEECGIDVGKLGTVEDWVRAQDWSEVL